MKRFGLSKEEKIKREKEFKLIFSSGKTIFSENKKLKAVYLIKKESENTGTKIAVAVHKKAGKAVWRNRVKRLLRESYRLNKHVLIKQCEEKKVLLRIIFLPYILNEKNNRKIYLKEVMPALVDLMKKIYNNV